MKRYSISYAREVNTHAAKSGIKFQYGERTDNAAEAIERYKQSKSCFGIQIKDSKTKEIIFSEVRKIVGKLTITFTDGERTWTSCDNYVNLEYMSEREKYYSTNYRNQFNKNMRVIKVEKELY